ncbi:MAG: c-type cytochrome, partial [Blastocatellia bacterium]
AGGPLGPPLTNVARRRGQNAGDLSNWIVGHNRELTPGSMPAFRQLKPDDLKELSEWLIELDKPLHLAVQTEVAASGAGESAGAASPKAYADNCAMCHGDHGKGGIGPSLIGVTAKAKRTDADLMKIMTASSRQYGLKDPMPASFSGINDNDKLAIIGWLKTIH